MTKLTRLLTGAAIALTLAACGKTISVKEDATNYQAAEMKIQAELQPRQQALMQKVQTLQQHPEKFDELIPEVESFIADAKVKLSAIKPQTDAVKKFQAQEIKSIEDMGPFMKDVSTAIQTKNMAKLQAAQEIYMKAMQDLATARGELLKEAAK